MATVFVPSLLRGLCGGASKLEFDAANLGELLRAVDVRCPGFYERVVEKGQLRPELAFAIDGEVIPLALHDTLAPGTELTIVPAIGGG